LKETGLEDDLERITKIVRNLFDEYQGPVTPMLSAPDVAQWNSLMNIQFLVLIEQAFGVRFSSREVGQIKNIGELMATLKTRRALK
jgi:acyl carrier protein